MNNPFFARAAWGAGANPGAAGANANSANAQPGAPGGAPDGGNAVTRMVRGKEIFLRMLRFSMVAMTFVFLIVHVITGIIFNKIPIAVYFGAILMGFTTSDFGY